MDKALVQLPVGTVQSSGVKGQQRRDADRQVADRSAGKSEGVSECGGELGGVHQHADNSPHTLPAWQPHQASLELVLLAGVRIVLLTMGHNGAALAINSALATTSTLSSAATQPPQMPHLEHAVARLWKESKSCVRTWQCKVAHRGLSSSQHDVPLCYTITHYPALPLRVPPSSKNVNGAGDCLLAATAAAMCMGVTMESAVAVGMEAARVTVESGENVPYKLLRESVLHLLI